MKKAILALALFVVGGNVVSAQTTYPIPSATKPTFIDYGGVYCNLFVDDVSEVINGVSYEVSTTIHFTSGNPAATFGTIDFAFYPPNGGPAQVTSIPLTNITGTLGPYNKDSTFSADFAGALTGSLTFHLHAIIGRRAVSYSMPNSFFMVD
jgi:hypothetical protein